MQSNTQPRAPASALCLAPPRTTATAQPSKSQLVSEAHPAVTARPIAERAKTRRLQMEEIALWLFLAGMFVASAVAAYLFWLKVSSHSP